MINQKLPVTYNFACLGVVRFENQMRLEFQKCFHQMRQEPLVVEMQMEYN